MRRPTQRGSYQVVGAVLFPPSVTGVSCNVQLRILYRQAQGRGEVRRCSDNRYRQDGTTQGEDEKTALERRSEFIIFIWMKGNPDFVQNEAHANSGRV